MDFAAWAIDPEKDRRGWVCAFHCKELAIHFYGHLRIHFAADKDRAGLEKVLMQPFDLAVVDVNMPQMDGMTFIRTLRGKELPMAAMPVLVTSTEAKEHDIAAARAAGANFYLTKPISQESLIEHVVLLCGAA